MQSNDICGCAKVTEGFRKQQQQQIEPPKNYATPKSINMVYGSCLVSPPTMLYEIKSEYFINFFFVFAANFTLIIHQSGYTDSHISHFRAYFKKYTAVNCLLEAFFNPQMRISS